MDKVASNRRILGPDGKVQYTRWTATKDPAVRDLPVGTIDPVLRLISLWNGDTPLVALTYYATHPQSYYRTGRANPDFPGIARNQRQEATGVVHVHFNGAGGNITAGKWNDGAPANRQVLADRLAAGMAQAWDTTRKQPISAARPGLAEPAGAAARGAGPGREEAVGRPGGQGSQRGRAGVRPPSTWSGSAAARRRTGSTSPACGSAEPGSCTCPASCSSSTNWPRQQLRPDLFVCLAAYGDYAPGYIGTEIAYSQGGYETSPGVSLVAPSVEGLLLETLRKLLQPVLRNAGSGHPAVP